MAVTADTASLLLADDTEGPSFLLLLDVVRVTGLGKCVFLGPTEGGSFANGQSPQSRGLRLGWRQCHLAPAPLGLPDPSDLNHDGVQLPFGLVLQFHLLRASVPHEHLRAEGRAGSVSNTWQRGRPSVTACLASLNAALAWLPFNLRSFIVHFSIKLLHVSVNSATDCDIIFPVLSEVFKNNKKKTNQC